MNRLQGLWLRLRHRLGGQGGKAGDRSPHFHLFHPGNEILLFRAYAEQPHMTQLAMNLIRRFPSPMGLVLVEYRPGPKEWLSSYLGRARTLAALFKIRDLLGVAGLDIAIVSPPLGAEIIIDHLGILEVRTGAWNEGMIRTVFEEAGFKERWGGELQDPSTPMEIPYQQEHLQRIQELVRELKLKPAASGD